MHLTALTTGNAGKLGFGLTQNSINAGGGIGKNQPGQKKLDAMAHDIVRAALVASPVAVYASEGAQLPEVQNPGGPLAVAVDPLDVSSNIDTLAPGGTIFSILSADADVAQDAAAPFSQPGRAQLAASFLI